MDHKKGTDIKYDVATTMYITILKDKEYTFTRPNFHVEFELNEETAKLTLHTGPLQRVNVGDKFNLFVRATTDPTPRNATDAVSLGFMHAGWRFNSCKLIENDPPVFIGWIDLYDKDTLMDMWDYVSE